MFVEGLKPAFDIGRSVSPVAGAANDDAKRAASKGLALDVAQYWELRVFARFGTELDMETRNQLDRGEKIRTILTQPQYEPLPVAHQIAIIYAATKGYLDEVPLKQVPEFEKIFIRFLRQQHAGLLAEFSAGHWDEQLEGELKDIIQTFIQKQYETGFLTVPEELDI